MAGNMISTPLILPKSKIMHVVEFVFVQINRSNLHQTLLSPASTRNELIPTLSDQTRHNFLKLLILIFAHVYLVSKYCLQWTKALGNSQNVNYGGYRRSVNTSQRIKLQTVRHNIS